MHLKDCHWLSPFGPRRSHTLADIYHSFLQQLNLPWVVLHPVIFFFPTNEQITYPTIASHFTVRMDIELMVLFPMTEKSPKSHHACPRCTFCNVRKNFSKRDHLGLIPFSQKAKIELKVILGSRGPTGLVSYSGEKPVL